METIDKIQTNVSRAFTNPAVRLSVLLFPDLNSDIYSDIACLTSIFIHHFSS